jgi:hypothetical protein
VSGEVPSASGGVTINGVAYSADKVVVFVHVGHSNMAGRATGPAIHKPYFYETDAALWSYHYMNPIQAAGPFVWRPAKEPMSPDVMTGDKAGPGMALLRAAKVVAKPGTQLAAIGHGHSGMQGGNCRGYRRDGILYRIAMGPAMALRGKVTFGGIFTMLGVTERHLSANDQAGFLECMKGLAQDMRTDLGEPNLPFIVGDWDWADDRDAAAVAAGKVIIPQLKMIPTVIPRAALVPLDGFKYSTLRPTPPDTHWEDGHHFSMTGHKEWGLRAVKILVDKGWASWATP